MSSKRLTIFNGSPRGRNSNTAHLLAAFLKGFNGEGGEVEKLHYLIKEKQIDQQVEDFKNAGTIFLAFPLYVDSVPGMVKHFIEKIGPFNGESRKIFFLVHSGFPEGIHSVGVSGYLQLLSRRWKMECLGVIIKPGSEGIRMRPPAKNQKLFEDFESLGAHFAGTGTLETGITDRLKKPYLIPGPILAFLKLWKSLGLMDKYWNQNLKKNNAYKKRFDAPYLER